MVDPESKKVEEFLNKKESHGAVAGGGRHAEANQPTGRTENAGHAKSEKSSKSDQGGKDESVTAGPRRLMDVLFAPNGDALYVVDFGALVVKNNSAVPAAGTGVSGGLIALVRMPPAYGGEHGNGH